MRALISPATESRSLADAGHYARALMFIRDVASREKVMSDPLVPDRVKLALKAAVDPGATTDSTFGEPLTGYPTEPATILESLTSGSAFDRMRAGGMLPLPFKTRAVSTTATLSASTAPEAGAKVVGSLSLDGVTLDPVKAAGILVLSSELVMVAGPASVAFIGRELKKAVSRAADSTYLAALATAAGSTVASVSRPLEDLRRMLAAAELGEDARVYWVMEASNVRALATMANDDGSLAFPNMTITGGTIAGVTVVPSDEMSAGETVLADATQIAGNAEAVSLQTMRHANVTMNTTPDSPDTASTVTVNLWQRNLRGLLAERWLAYEVLNAGAVIRGTGAAYGSPDSPI